VSHIATGLVLSTSAMGTLCNRVRYKVLSIEAGGHVCLLYRTRVCLISPQQRRAWECLRSWDVLVAGVAGGCWPIVDCWCVLCGPSVFNLRAIER